MSKLKGPLILFVVVAVLMIVGFLGKRMFLDSSQINTSDATGDLTTLTIAGDGYLGYWFINSPTMKIISAKSGLNVDFIDDGGAYQDRLKNFSKGKYDAIVLPVNSYLEHGLPQNFPGVIVAAISESKGADALVGFPDVLPNNKVNDLNNDQLKIVYTGGSPSSFLLDLTIADFDLNNLQSSDKWREEVGSSEEVYEIAKKAKNDRSKGDAFVMWEPEVSKSIEKLGMKELWSSDKFAGYIIDVIVFHRDVVAKKPELVKEFMVSYFRTMDHYRNNREDMVKEMGDFTGLNDKAVNNMIKKIDWYDLDENMYQLFGITNQSNTYPSKEKMLASIIACANVMSRTQGFDQSDVDPYKIINSSFLQELSETGIRSIGTNNGEAYTFDALSKDKWAALPEIGTMRVEPISFQSGTNSLDMEGEILITNAAKLLVNNYPRYRVIVRGHTGPGDEAANLKLSQDRANTVLKQLIEVEGLDPNRLIAEGVGSKQPPAKKMGESTRGYRLRMARVEFVLVDESPL